MITFNCLFEPFGFSQDKLKSRITKIPAQIGFDCAQPDKVVF